MLDLARRCRTIPGELNPPPPAAIPPARPQRKLWIVLSRPDTLVDALVIAGVCRERFGSVQLVYEDSRWWERAGWERYRGAFDGVLALPKVPTCRGLIDLPRYYRRLVERQRRLAALGIAAEDAVVCLSSVLGLANAVASAYPRVPKVLIVTRKKFEDSSRPIDRLRYRHTTSSWFQYHLLEPLAGVGRTVQLKPRRNRGGDGVRVTRLAAPLAEVFDAVIALSNAGRDLPGGAGPRVFASPFPRPGPLLGALPAAGGLAPRPRVVLFGTPFKLVQNLPAAEYAPILNRCLDYLRRHYGGRCNLIYRPHPAETDELDALRADGFTVENDQEVAQLYFLKHLAGIEAVYSVSSTVSRVAYNYGLNAYALWPCFPFPAGAVTYFQTLMDEVPPEFEIRSLDAPPAPYARGVESAGGAGEFPEVLRAALERAGRAESGCAPTQTA